MNMRSRNVVVGLITLAVLSAAACFRAAEPTKIKCVAGSYCPSGYYCSMENSEFGHCAAGSGHSDSGAGDFAGTGGRAGVDAIGMGVDSGDARSGGAPGGGGSVGVDGALRDMAAGGANGGGTSGGSGGIASADGPTGTGGTISTTDVTGGAGSTTVPVGTGGATTIRDAAPTDAPGLPNGTACTADSQCGNGFCTDGHCCDGRCDGNCESCTTGTCSFSSTPRKACSGTGKCVGTCEKANQKACTFPDSQTVCASQTCSGGELKGKSLCDGLGNCPAQSKTTCDSNLCLADGSDCSGSCTGTSCGTGKYCAGSTCATFKNQGDSCSDKSECSTGFCVDGYCCESGCTGTCTTCAATHGKCTNTTSPRTGKSCSGTAPCNATCNGSSPDCTPASTTTSCGTASCLTATMLQLAGTCSSQGTCTQNTQTCTLCLTSTNACAECSPTAKQCSATGVPQHCDSTGHWVNDTGCPACQACSLGVCQPLTPGTACTGGVCNSAGSCTQCSQGANCTTGITECQTGAVDCSTGAVVCNATNKSPGTSCNNGAVSCSLGTLYPYQCNGSGQCVAASSGTACSSGQCSSSSACQACTVSTAPTIQASTTSRICGSSTTHPGSVTLTRVGGTLGLGARWVWYKNSLPTAAGGGVSAADPSYTPTVDSSATYYLRGEGTCGVGPAASSTVNVYANPPQITIDPSSMSVACTGSSWSYLTASLSSTSAPAASQKWFYETADTTAPTLCGGYYFKDVTTFTLGVVPVITQTDEIQVIDICGQEGWGYANLACL
jgi:hypothetical protein